MKICFIHFCIVGGIKIDKKCNKPKSGTATKAIFRQEWLVQFGSPFRQKMQF